MLRRFEAHHFRCFEKVSLDLDGRSAGLVGPNASGKTTLLEGLYFLSYGRSFRANDRRQLARRSAGGFRLAAQIADALGPALLSARWNGTALKAEVDGRAAAGIGELATRLRIHLIDPSVHRLVEGLPQERRRLLDTGVFHVEPSYLSEWRQFRRVLKQRNAALRGANPARDARLWDAQLSARAAVVDVARENYVQRWSTAFRIVAAAFGLMDASLEYRRGWDEDAELSALLESHLARDIANGVTLLGPQRADVKLLLGGQGARQLVSRGQQKLLASALVLAQLKVIEKSGSTPLLLVDDAGAELDVDNLGKFLSVVGSMPAQLLVTATFPNALESLPELLMFHVKQDGLSRML